MPNNLSTRIITAKKALFDLKYASLNPEQRRAVFTTSDPLLVLAGAGSGKTTVLINRIEFITKFGDAYWRHIRDTNSEDEAEVLESVLKFAQSEPDSVDIDDVLASYAVDPCHPSGILAITFTNKAAKEIKERLEKKLGANSLEIWAGTFHSICVRILRRHIQHVNYSSNFTIYDTDDTKKLINSILKSLQIDDKKFPAKDIMGEIGRAKDRLLSPEGYAKEAGSDFRLKKIAEVYAEYQRQLITANALDFDDMIFITVRLLLTNEEVRNYWQSRFRYVMVDEYQDTNFAQYMFMSLMAQRHQNVMVVGDDDQSIYKFRGATIENILNFDKNFKNAAVVKLERNYRSTKNILDAANSVITNNTGRRDKALWTQADEGEKIRIKQVPTQNDESVFIVETIQEMQTEGRKYSDFAVLYRVNAQSANLESVFAKSGIPYRMLGGTRFYERKEIKDIIAYLSVVNNPGDTVRLRRIINEPSRKIGETTLLAVEQLAPYHNKSSFDIIEHASEYPALSRAATRLEGFAEIINKLRSLAVTESLPQLIEQTIELSGYRTMLEEKGESEQDRLENIKELISNAISYQERVEEPTLSGFLEEVALVSDVDKYDSTADAVVLMTIHSAKGLEFPVVFIPGMEDGIFPSMQSTYNPEDIEEERRLAYVAITRAKEQLYVLHTSTRLLYGKTTMNPLSRFAAEIHEDFVIAEAIEEKKPAQYMTNNKNNIITFNSNKNKLPVNNELKKPYSTGSMNMQSEAYLKNNFKIGDTVGHANFGQGVIVSITDMSGDTMYEIAFDTKGTKKMMGSFAKLTKIN